MTHDRDHTDGELAALERLLASHGADRTRWPAPERLRFASLIAHDVRARRLVAEAEAIDALLSEVPSYRGDTAKLADRIVTAAAREGRGGRAAPARSALAPASGIVVGKGAQVGRAPASRPRRFNDSLWAPGALLAASLVLGAFLGTSGAINPMGPLTTTVASDETSEGSGDMGQLALGTEASDLIEEDIL